VKLAAIGTTLVLVVFVAGAAVVGMIVLARVVEAVIGGLQ